MTMSTASDAPIGMFDSGFGGLTVARAVIDLLPAEDLLYVGDTGRYPYGNKPAAEVRDYALEIAHSLVADHGAKAVVVACNTAASVALDDLSSTLSVPVIGVVAPGASALVRATTTGRVGVIGTEGTIGSDAYRRAVAATGASVSLTQAACPGFVELVERDETSGPDATLLAERLLAPVRAADVDALLLGCTHYPFLSDVIARVMGPGVRLVNGAAATALAVRDAVVSAGVARSTGGGRHRFLSSGDVEWFARLGRRLLGPELDTVGTWPETATTRRR
jgi:glutamate racemase